MKDKISDVIFSFSGLSIFIGVIGFMSGIVTMFININDQISIKWLLFLVLISISSISILLKVIYDFSCEKIPPPPYESPISYIHDQRVLVIKRNENFINNIIVGCYSVKNEIDNLACIGVVHIVQDKVIQIKVLLDSLSVLKEDLSMEDLKNISIRPVVPVTALQQFSELEM